MRFHKASPGAVPSRPELWGSKHCFPLSQNFGEDRLSLPPWFTPRPASLASLLANWLVALSLAFHVNAVYFKRFTAGPADPAWCWLTVFFKLGLIYCLRPLSGLKSGGHESGHRNFGFQARYFLIFKIKFSFFQAKNSDDFFIINLKKFVASRKSKNYHLQLHSWLIFLFFYKKIAFKHTFCAQRVHVC